MRGEKKRRKEKREKELPVSVRIEATEFDKATEK